MDGGYKRSYSLLSALKWRVTEPDVMPELGRQCPFGASCGTCGNSQMPLALLVFGLDNSLR